MELHDLSCFFVVGFCALAAPWESFIIGFLGAVLALGGTALLNRLHIDDPVGKIELFYITSMLNMTLNVHI